MCSRCLGGRLLLTSWWLFSLLIVSVYTANMAAALTATREDGSVISFIIAIIIIVIIIFITF